jgi:hypothetical protein
MGQVQKSWREKRMGTGVGFCALSKQVWLLFLFFGYDDGSRILIRSQVPKVKKREREKHEVRSNSGSLLTFTRRALRLF